MSAPLNGNGTMDSLTAATASLMQAIAAGNINTAQFTMFQSLDKIIKNFVTFYSPIFDQLTRTPVNSTTTNWEQLLEIIVDSDGTLAEGGSSDGVSFDYAPASSVMKHQGLGGGYTDQMQELAVKNGTNILSDQFNFTLATLKELVELQIIGGTILGIANPKPPVCSSSVDENVGQLPAGDYVVSVCALTAQGTYKRNLGYQKPALKLLSGGHTALATTNITIADDKSVLHINIPDVPNAFGYAIFVGSPAGQTLQLCSGTNSVTLDHLVTNGQAASTITANTSANAKAFDGISTQAIAAGCMYTSLDGKPMTSNNKEGVIEIDQINDFLWSTYRLSPTTYWVGSEVRQAMTDAYLINGRHIQITPADGKITVNAQIEVYRNTSANLTPINVKTHPLLPKNYFMAITEVLPYANTNIANVMDMAVMTEYKMTNFAKIDHNTKFDISGSSVFRHFMPVSVALMTNIGKGIS